MLFDKTKRLTTGSKRHYVHVVKVVKMMSTPLQW